MEQRVANDDHWSTYFVVHSLTQDRSSPRLVNGWNSICAFHLVMYYGELDNIYLVHKTSHQIFSLGVENYKKNRSTSTAIAKTKQGEGLTLKQSVCLSSRVMNVCDFLDNH